jgi:hypothetical protein
MHNWIVFAFLACSVHAQDQGNPAPRDNKKNDTAQPAGKTDTKQNPPTITNQENSAHPQNANQQHADVNVTSVPPLSFIKDPADYVLISATALLVIIGGLQLWFLRQTIDATNKSANAARDSADVTLKAFANSHRPRFVIRYMDMVPPWNMSGIPISGSFRLYNSGESAAILIRKYFAVTVGHLPRINPYEDMHGYHFAPNTVLRPGDNIGLGFPTVQVTLTSDEEFVVFKRMSDQRDLAKKGISDPNATPLFITGWLEYLDESKTKRRVGFCQQFDFKTERFIRHPDQDYEYGDLGYPEK